MGTQCPSAASPGDPQGELARRAKRRWPGPLVSFPSLGKKLATRGRGREKKALSLAVKSKTPQKKNGTAVKNRKSPDGKLKIPLPHWGFVIFNKLPLSELRVAHRSRVQLRPQTRPAPVGSRFEKPQPEVNSVRGKVLPPAKRLDGALAPPHLRWGPRRGAAGNRFHIGGLSVLP